jgi:hypothetical protein
MAETTAQTTPSTTPAVAPPPTSPTTEVKSAEVAPQVEQKPEAGKSLVGGETPEGKADPKAEAEKAVAEDIQIKLPEGVKADEKLMGDFKGIAKELGLKSEGAQKLLDLHLNTLQRAEKEFSEAAAQRADTWYKAIEADAELGGVRLKETAQTVQKAVVKFGGDEFKKEIDAAGLGNWPPLVKFLHKVGLTMKDDSVALDHKPAPAQANDSEALYRSLYNKTPQMFSGK